MVIYSEIVRNLSAQEREQPRENEVAVERATSFRIRIPETWQFYSMVKQEITDKLVRDHFTQVEYFFYIKNENHRDSFFTEPLSRIIVFLLFGISIESHHEL